MLRIGNGYDVHRFKEKRKLILGGIEIPHEKGLDGHSDADVLVHSIMDAMLGALALGDIGQHFPDNDERYRGISSMVLLGHVNKLIKEKGYSIVNLDSIIVAQKPKLKPYIEDMRINIAKELDIDRECVSVKATTEENLGFTGEELGIKSYCVILLEKLG
ncbi:2-C-methyl-D-erythritol 2,4-cyclodiphosphate synthase [Ilyobacter polytropus]|uniref:2-C-methyl-D-erythritol 2,4-cyclodiphosphate synthase n=1 Tax=Ilyobacter polytropus (strain ATCC 51220 / DSM 2926 / LMG 16218 / CuHBu1) TaxID=572544 RepID=E3H9R0_ILYPC|nr:2-C-methyl-D-erythritol 2,4-cyclodiphosphate synthase [Ilyobacter polytropus]ADO83589.1 2C-methyl-D-erythritol 2,4-cyclodiphosphate synthase [Ilyobacter polytropus DSM 2926]